MIKMEFRVWCYLFVCRCACVYVHGCMHCCRYFSLQAKEPLCMGDRVRVDIELGICNERGPLEDSFVAAQQIAYDKMIEACNMYVTHCQHWVAMYKPTCKSYHVYCIMSVHCNIILQGTLTLCICAQIKCIL